MFSYVPTILLPPLVPPPSISERINQLLDTVQNLFKQHKFERARDHLFTAYALFQTDDALMDYYKSYFHTMNGLLVLKMVEFGDYNKDDVRPEHLVKVAITAFTDAIDISQKLFTADRAFPRFFLGFLFFKLKNYDFALRFFRQAETLAISSEGGGSTFAAMASFDIAVVGLKMLSQKVYSAKGMDRFDHEKVDSRIVQNQIEGQAYDMEIVDTQSVYHMERIGFIGLDSVEDLVTDWDEPPRPEEEYQTIDCDGAPRSQQSFQTLLAEFERIRLIFEKSVGANHFYSSEAALACTACRECMDILAKELDPPLQGSEGILGGVHHRQDPVEAALYGFGAKFKKIPARAMYVPIKKGKTKGKGKK